MRYIVDIETNAPSDFRTLEGLETIHCIVAIPESGGPAEVYYDGRDLSEFQRAGSVKQGAKKLADCDGIIGHNLIGFDVPVLERFAHVHFDRTRVFDTQVLSYLAYPDLYAVDLERRWVPEGLAGSHSLEAWGHRIGVHKDIAYRTGDNAWNELTNNLVRYCVQDVEVNRALWASMRRLTLSRQSVLLEHAFADVLQRQMARGAQFSASRAYDVAGELEGRRYALEQRIAELVEPFVDELVSPVRQVRRTVTTPFNPRSGAHKVRHFKERRGWRPLAKTETGRPKMDETVLKGLAERWPEAALMAEHAEITKIMGYLADGDHAWTKLVKPSGRIHGDIRHNGTVTSRCTHSRPNLGNVPKQGEYGELCRSLFVAPFRMQMVGCDASGLELRMLAHHLAEWDGGAYARLIDEGDVHQHTADVLGVDRELAKRVMYATLYGAGKSKIGRVLGASTDRGAEVQARLLDGIVGLRPLSERVKALRNLTALDGRRIPVRSEHAALNSQLQADGAVVMKKAVVLMDQTVPAVAPSWRQVLFVHDEVQAEVYPEEAQIAAVRMSASIVEAGEALGLRVPLKGAAKIGASWNETH